MRFEYQYFIKDIITLGHNRRVYGERIEAGWILVVKCCYFYVPQIGTPDVVTLFVERGPHEVPIRSRGKEVGRRGMTVMCPFYVGEYQRIVGYAPNSEIGDEISLSVMGYLRPLFEWRTNSERE